MPVRFVLDTHIVLELLLWNSPKQAWLRGELAAARASLLSRADALAELQLVLSYPQFALAEQRQAEVFETYASQVQLVDLPASSLALPRCADVDDQKFLEIAWHGQANGLLTRDKKLLKIGKHRLFRQRFAVCVPEQLEARLAQLQTLSAPVLLGF